MNLYYENIKQENFAHKLDGKTVMDLISVNSGAKKDWEIFVKWVDDFNSRKIPYVITETVKVIKVRGADRNQYWKTMWVEEKAPPEINGGKSREEIKFDVSKCI